MSQDGGANWLPPILLSDDATGQRYEDTLSATASANRLGDATQLAVAATENGTFVHACWAVYDARRTPSTPERPRRFVACTRLVNPFCGNGAVDAGEACDDGNRVDGDCCNATCRAETGTPCTDAEPCTVADACGTDGRCGGHWATADDIGPWLSTDLDDAACASVDVPRRILRRAGAASHFLERGQALAESGKATKAKRTLERGRDNVVHALDALHARRRRFRAAPLCKAHLDTRLTADRNWFNCVLSGLTRSRASTE